MNSKLFLLWSLLAGQHFAYIYVHTFECGSTANPAKQDVFCVSVLIMVIGMAIPYRCYCPRTSNSDVPFRCYVARVMIRRGLRWGRCD